MEQDHDSAGSVTPRAPTPFEREINALCAFKPTDVLVTGLVELVCTDEISAVFARLTVAEGDVEDTLAHLNRQALIATDGNMKWRRARSFSAPAQHCAGCGAWRCWCGASRLISRSEGDGR